MEDIIVTKCCPITIITPLPEGIEVSCQNVDNGMRYEPKKTDHKGEVTFNCLIHNKYVFKLGEKSIGPIEVVGTAPHRIEMK